MWIPYQSRFWFALCALIVVLGSGHLGLANDKDVIRTNIEIFANDGFEPGIPGHRVLGKERKNVIQRFGKPRKSLVKREPDSREPGLINELFTWEYPGLTIKMVSPLTSTQGTWISEIVLTNPKHRLKYSLGIGKPRSDFITALGKPSKETRETLNYSTDYYITLNKVSFHSGIEVMIEFDNSDKAKKITWSYGAD